MNEKETSGICNRTFLKYLAVIAMVIDHVGMLFVPLSTVPGCICRVVGRFTAPVMCYFLAEGFVYTSSRKKYGIRLFIFAVISQIPYALMNYDAILKFDFNMIYTLFMSFLVLCAYERYPESNLKWLLIGALIGATYIGDWGIFGPLYVLAFYIYRENRKWQIICFSAISLGVVLMDTAFCLAKGYHWYGELWQLGLFIFLPVFFCYNGRAGSRAAFHKWFFYIVYPVHMIVLWFIKYRM